MQEEFDYAQAFDRNIGWLTEWEQLILREKTVAIAGMGGVGGVHLMTLARLGVGGFHIADLDHFEIANFNRQIGATVDTLGRPKVEVLEQSARAVNPELRIKTFAQGVQPDNIDAFLEGVDLFIDGFDFFVLDVRAQVFARCRELGIPAITAAPIGMGAAWLIFLPGGMSFEEWFRLEGRTPEQRYVNFLVGVAPRGWHRAYLADPTRVELTEQRGPSTAMACQLCAGVASTEAMKILLNRGGVRPVPHHHHFDAYLGRFATGWLPGGNANPVQRARLAVGYRIYGRMAERAAKEVTEEPEGDLMRILDLARWAPSGDNAQPWRFRVLGDDRVEIRVALSPGNIYEYNDGQPTLLSAGFLLETMRVAASGHGRRFAWEADGRVPGAGRIVVTLAPDAGLPRDPLFPYLTQRSVDRRSYQDVPLTARQKEMLEEALGGELRPVWREAKPERRRIARLNALATDIRMRAPEAYEVHRRVFDWSGRDSAVGIPAASIGLDKGTQRIMRWAVKDWRRIDLLNRFGGGTRMAQLQIDLLPGVRCAAHLGVAWRRRPSGEEWPDAMLRAGMALQRLWLTATRLGLVMQPGLAALAFAFYARHDVSFTADERLRARAGELRRALDDAFPGEAEDLIFLARIGFPRGARRPVRSVRRPLSELLEE